MQPKKVARQYVTKEGAGGKMQPKKMARCMFPKKAGRQDATKEGG
jgi:hypothetical protein